MKNTKYFACALILGTVISQSGFAKDNEADWGRRGMGYGMMGSGMGPGMMGSGMGMMCPFSKMSDVKVSVAETKDGVTITYTAKDAKEAARIHKMAQIMKLSQELDEETQQQKK